MNLYTNVPIFLFLEHFYIEWFTDVQTGGMIHSGRYLGQRRLILGCFERKVKRNQQGHSSKTRTLLFIRSHVKFDIFSWKKNSLPLFYSLDERYHNVDDQFIRYQSCSILFAVYKKIQKPENVLSFNSVIDSCFDGRSIMYFQA